MNTNTYLHINLIHMYTFIYYPTHTLIALDATSSLISINVGNPPVVIPFNLCIVVVGGSASNRSKKVMFLWEAKMF